MNKVLVLILCVNCIECQSICEVIKGNASDFVGIQAYHRWIPKDQYVMYRNGSQWEFEIKWKGSEVMGIEVSKQAIDFSDNQTINAFGVKSDTFDYNCFVKYKEVLKDTIDIECKDKIGTKAKEWFALKTSADSPVFAPVVNTSFNTLYVLNKRPNEEHKEDVCYEVTKTRVRFRDLDECKNTVTIPAFVTSLTNVSFRRTIDAVLDYSHDSHKGYLLLITSKGRPNYCFIAENQTFEEQCLKQSKPYLEECFAEKTSINMSLIIWILIGISCAVIIILVVLIVWTKTRQSDRTTLGDRTATEDLSESQISLVGHDRGSTRRADGLSSRADSTPDLSQKSQTSGRTSSPRADKQDVKPGLKSSQSVPNVSQTTDPSMPKTKSPTRKTSI